jgi:hypothetical protein
MLAAFLELPARVPAPTGWWNLLLIPSGCSFRMSKNLFGGTRLTADTPGNSAFRAARRPF